jgi:hypothetical protein
MSSTIYTMNYNSATCVTCSLTFIAYKYIELQMSSIIQKLSCKASYKIPFFLIMLQCKWNAPKKINTQLQNTSL